MNFIPNQKPTKGAIPDDLEKKISVVNKYLSTAKEKVKGIKASTDSLLLAETQAKAKLKVQEERLVKLDSELEEKELAIETDNKTLNVLNSKIDSSTRELTEITDKIKLQQVEFKTTDEAMVIRERAVSAKESGFNDKTKELNAREVRLDKYAIKIKNAIDALKL